MKNYEVKRPSALDLNSWGSEFHEVMLNDTERMEAFREAIREQVKEGDVVVDLGTGTGVLARFAFEAGASKVYGIEFNETILEEAKKNLVEFGNKFIPILGNSINVELPEKADVVISETIGNFADNENCVLYLKDAKRRFLKKDGVMIPSQIDQVIVPVNAPEADRQISKLDSLNYFETVIPKTDHVASPIKVHEFVFDEDEDVEYDRKTIFHLKKNSVITGFKGWFVAKLSDRVEINTEEVRNDSSWNHFYIPVEPLECKSDMAIRVWIKKYNGNYKITYKKL